MVWSIIIHLPESYFTDSSAFIMSGFDQKKKKVRISRHCSRATRRVGSRGCRGHRRPSVTRFSSRKNVVPMGRCPSRGCAGSPVRVEAPGGLGLRGERRLGHPPHSPCTHFTHSSGGLGGEVQKWDCPHNCFGNSTGMRTGNESTSHEVIPPRESSHSIAEHVSNEDISARNISFSASRAGVRGVIRWRPPPGRAAPRSPAVPKRFAGARGTDSQLQRVLLSSQTDRGAFRKFSSRRSTVCDRLAPETAERGFGQWNADHGF